MNKEQLKEDFETLITAWVQTDGKNEKNLIKILSKYMENKQLFIQGVVKSNDNNKNKTTKMTEPEILIGQIWKSNYADINYKILGGGFFSKIEMYNIENPWDCKEIYKKELKKHFTLQENVE